MFSFSDDLDFDDNVSDSSQGNAEEFQHQYKSEMRAQSLMPPPLQPPPRYRKTQDNIEAKLEPTLIPVNTDEQNYHHHLNFTPFPISKLKSKSYTPKLKENSQLEDGCATPTTSQRVRLRKLSRPSPKIKLKSVDKTDKTISAPCLRTLVHTWAVKLGYQQSESSNVVRNSTTSQSSNLFSSDSSSHSSLKPHTLEDDTKNSNEANSMDPSEVSHKMFNNLKRPSDQTSSPVPCKKNKPSETASSSSLGQDHKTPSSSRLLAPNSPEKSTFGFQDTESSPKSSMSTPPWSPKIIKTSLDPSPYVKNTIDLLQHKREIQRRLENLESSGIVQNIGSIGSMPTITNSNTKGEYLLENIPMKYCEVKNVIMKRLAIHLAHGGFTHSKLQPFEVLGDAVNDFYVQMTSRLKQIRERELAGVDHGFPDPMERVLVEMGMGGVRGLEKFYKSKVFGYQERMNEQCTQLRTHFANTVHKGFRRAPPPISSVPSTSLVLSSNSGPKDMPSSLIRLLRTTEPISIPDVDVKPQLNNETLMESNLLRLNFEGTAAVSTNT